MDVDMLEDLTHAMEMGFKVPHDQHGPESVPGTNSGDWQSRIKR